jgi:two-component system phosphate regulon sensor histidine kinase PhoR
MFIQKIGLISIGVALIIISLIISLFVLYTKQKIQKDLIVNGVALTDMVANYSATGLDKVEANNIIKIVDRMGTKSGFVYGMIIDTKQKIIANTNSMYVDNTLIANRAASSNNPLQQIYEDSRTNHTIYEFSRPIYMNGKKEGTVRLGFTPDINPLFSESDMRGILLVATLFFSLVPIFYYLVRRSSRPLVALNKQLNNLREKNDFGIRAVHSGEAMGTVADNFNEVISEYKAQYQKLSVSGEDMEVGNSILAYEKERIESVIDSIDDGIMVRDLVGSIIHVNRSMAYLLKLSSKDAIGKTIQDCIDNEEIISFIEREQFNDSSFTQKNLEVILDQFDREKTLLISYLPLLSSEECVMGNVIIAKDITAARMTQQNQSDFIAHVSHELRTPLTTIKSYVEMLMDNEVSDDDTKIDFYNTINDEANRLARLISNLLNISKIETGSLAINKDMIKTGEFIKDIVHSIESQAVSKNINLEPILPDKLSALVVEKDLLRVAILNILGNAIKYTPPGGSITLTVKENDSNVTLDISDTGYGISNEELPHIFDKFFRSSDDTIKQQTGNGLGLALSREIIRLHDGKIEVSSKLQQGTRFTLTLPKEDSPRISPYNKRMSSLIDTQRPLGDG